MADCEVAQTQADALMADPVEATPPTEDTPAEPVSIPGRLLSAVAKVCAKDDGRFALNAVRVSGHTLTAADGAILAEVTTPADFGPQALVQFPSLKAQDTAVSRDNGTLTLAQPKSGATYDLPADTEKSFPNTDELWPGRPWASFCVDAAALRRLLDVVLAVPRYGHTAFAEFRLHDGDGYVPVELQLSNDDPDYAARMLISAVIRYEDESDQVRQGMVEASTRRRAYVQIARRLADKAARQARMRRLALGPWHKQERRTGTPRFWYDDVPYYCHASDGQRVTVDPVNESVVWNAPDADERR